MARPYIKNWASLRRYVIERAGGLCEICKKDVIAAGEVFEVDHIQAIIDGGSPDDVDNLRALCADCHLPFTIAQIKRNAKVKRIQAREKNPVRKWKKKIQSRPFSRMHRPWRKRP